MTNNRFFRLTIFMVSYAIAQPALACIPPSLQSVKKLSDVIVEGSFVIDSEAKGEGHIRAKRTFKGMRKQTYEIRWDPETVPEELPDCGVTIPESGTVGHFALQKTGTGAYWLRGRWRPVKKDR